MKRRATSALVALSACLAATTTVVQPAGASEAPGPTRILIVGDSVTQGWKGDHTWRYFLWHDLADRGADVDFVGRRTGTFLLHDNGLWDWDYDEPDAYADPDFDQDHGATWAGRIGAKDNDLHDPIGPQVEQQRPDVVVSMWGINDLAREDTGPSDVVQTYREWVAEARAVDPDVDFVIARLPYTWLYDGEVVELNVLLGQLTVELSTEQSSVTLATMAEEYTREVDSRDHVHPSTSGERKIAAMIGAALVPMLERDDDPGAEPQPPAPAPVVAVPAAPAQVKPPAAPRGVRARRQGRRIVVTWRKPAGAKVVEVRAGRRTVRSTGRRIAVRAAARKVHVRAVNDAGASPWRKVRVRR